MIRAALAVFAFLACAGGALAQKPRVRDTLSAVEQYEDGYIRRTLAKHACTRDPRPEGKRIERIEVETEDIFDSSDQNVIKKIPVVGIVPKYANKLHAKTFGYVVEREVLFAIGQSYRQEIAEETERNLRAIVIFAIARVIACSGSKPDTVKVVVVTKDLWSLRLENDFQFSGGRFDFLRLAVTERNLAGHYKQLSTTFGLTRDTFSIGESFVDPRVFGSRIALQEAASLTFGRGGRGPEGGSIAFTVGQPLYSLGSEWGFDVTTNFNMGISRLFRGGDMFRCFAPAPGTTDVTCDNDIRSAAERANLFLTRDNVTPIQEFRILEIQASVVRRFGERIKHDISWGYGLRHRAFDLVGDFPDAVFRNAVAAEFLPRSEDAAFLFAGYRTFEATFRTYRNIARFAVTEDFQIGHDVRFVARWANKIFGLGNTFVELDASAQYRWELVRDNLFTVGTRAQSRAEGDGLINNRFSFVLSNISPVLGIGRLLFEASAIFRFDDRENVRSTLGGNIGLRGYDSDEFRGRHVVNLHLEYRTLPLDLATIQVGFVGFYDAGHAADEISQLRLRHSVGLGVRIFIPQINRASLRLDVGFPFSEGPDSFARQFSFSFDQFF